MSHRALFRETVYKLRTYFWGQTVLLHLEFIVSGNPISKQYVYWLHWLSTFSVSGQSPKVYIHTAPPIKSQTAQDCPVKSAGA